MPALTVKNIPEDLFEKLKAAANAHHRSLNSELLYCLETALMPQKIGAAERILRARELRPEIPVNTVSPEEIRKAVQEGRP